MALELHGGASPERIDGVALLADATFDGGGAGGGTGDNLVSVAVSDGQSIVEAALKPTNGVSITENGTLLMQGETAGESRLRAVTGDGTGSLVFKDMTYDNDATDGGVYSGISMSLDNATFSTEKAFTDLDYISVYSDSTFNVNEDVEVSDGLFIAHSTVRIAAGKTLTAGEMDAYDDGVLVFGIAADGTTAGKLVISDGGIDLEGTTVKIDLESPSTFSNTSPILLGVGDTALHGFDGEVGLAPTQVATLQTALYNFYLQDGTYFEESEDGTIKELWVQAEKARTIAEVGEQVSGSNKSAGATFDGLTSTTDPELQDILTAINGAATDKEINDILSSVQPGDNGAANGTINMINGALNLNSMHLDAVRQTGISSGFDTRGLRFWTQAFGQSADQNTRHGEAGFDADTGGIAVGVDSERLVEGAVVGLAFNYGKTNVNAANVNSTGTDIDSYQLTAYGEYDLGSKAYVNAQASYGYNKANTVRYNVGGLGGLTAYGDFNADQYSLRTEGGKALQVGSTTLTPKALAHWTHYVPDDYTETGAGGASLAVNQDSVDIVEVGAGIDASWKFRQNNGAELLPSIRTGYRYDLVGDRISSTSTFTGGGSAFSTEGVRPARGTLTLGTGIKYTLPNALELTANYDYEHKAEYNSHSGYLRAGYKF